MKCRVCDSTNLQLAIDLGLQPWCNHFLQPEEVGQEPFYPLHVVYCHDCKTVQLDYTVAKETMFGNHTYLSGITRSLREHFERIAQEVDQRFHAAKQGKSALGVGSNDGTELVPYQQLGYDVLGVESSVATAKIAQDKGIPTLNTFFNLDTAKQINRKFDVINASGVFFHLEELHSFTDGLEYCLANDGVFVVQFLYMNQIVKNMAFDQIYHEHLLYYNLNTIEILLNRHGLSMFDAYLAPIHGGSIIGFISRTGQRPPSERLQQMRQMEIDEQANELATYQQFAKRIEQMKQDNLAYLQQAKAQGKRVWGMGAPVKGNTLLNYFGIGTDLIEKLLEKNTLRKGLISPGMHIPVEIEDEQTQLPDIYYVLAWNFKKEILANNQHLLDKGIEFYFPVDPERT